MVEKEKEMKYKNRIDKHNIVVENTPYSLLVYWLSQRIENTTYILSADIGRDVIDRISKEHSIFVYDNKKIKNKLIRFLCMRFFQKIKLYFFIKDKIDKSDIFGSDHYIAFDIFKKYKYTLIEDGIGNYRDYNKEKLSEKSIKQAIKLLRYRKSFGVSVNCKKILLTGLAEVPKGIENKVEILNLKELWSIKTKDEQQKIMNYFGLNDKLIEDLKRKDSILLTQPISEDGWITEKEKIEIYRNIITKYNKNNFVIKTHPRETTDYKKVFPDILVLDEPFPFEMVNLLDIEFKKVITLFSTAAFDLYKGAEVEWYGASVHPKLEKKLGESLKNISLDHHTVNINER